MAIQWQVSFPSSSAPTYYRGGSARGAHRLPLEAFVINHLNTTRHTLVLGMSNIRRQAESQVRRMSRVDTGLMKSQVASDWSFATDRMFISFGWRQNQPFYAVFQEFGTRNGIRPMMAVHTAFYESVRQTERLIRGGN